MIAKTSPPSIAFLWRVTAVVAVLLLVFTLLMVVKVQTTSSSSFTGYINNQSPAVYLRSTPAETGRTIAILTPGAEVHVDRSTITEGITWYHVKSKGGRGWIPEGNLSVIKP